jgi:hypothetical protein
MNLLRERPRVTAAAFVALLVLLGLAMLAGGALAGGDNNCTTAGAHGHTQTVKGTS